MAINDVAKREQMLRQEGLNRGYETVVNDLYGSMSQSFGTGIVKGPFNFNKTFKSGANS